jgi:hypothetical protein
MLRVLEYQKGAASEIMDEITNALSSGTAVLVKGWEPEDAMEFNWHDIGKYRPPIWQEISWQGT